MADPGPDPDPDLERLRTELQHARESANADTAEVIENLTEALGRLDAARTEPKQDNLESIRAELARLADEERGETSRQLSAAREHVRDILKDRLASDQREGSDGST